MRGKKRGKSILNQLVPLPAGRKERRSPPPGKGCRAVPGMAGKGIGTLEIHPVLDALNQLEDRDNAPDLVAPGYSPPFRVTFLGKD